MNKAITKIAFLLIIISTSYFWSEAKACLCAPTDPPYKAYHEAKAAFIVNQQAAHTSHLKRFPTVSH
jgi:hypothetical protein